MADRPGYAKRKREERNNLRLLVQRLERERHNAFWRTRTTPTVARVNSLYGTTHVTPAEASEWCKQRIEQLVVPYKGKKGGT